MVGGASVVASEGPSEDGSESVGKSDIGIGWTAPVIGLAVMQGIGGFRQR